MMYITFILFMYKVLFFVPINLIFFSFQIFSPSIDHDAAIENICSDAISDDISDEGIGLLGGMD